MNVYIKMLNHIFAQETTLKKHKMKNIEKAAKNNVITFQIGIAQMLLMPVVNAECKRSF